MRSNWRVRLKLAWRRLRGRCVMCNGRRPGHRDCYHCSRQPRMCHVCAKHWNFGLAYSAKVETLYKELLRW